MKGLPAGPLFVAKGAYDAVASHAREVMPDECCGVLVGAAGDAAVDEVIRFDNLADRLHAADPEAFPRSARTAWWMDGGRLREVMARGDAAGRPVKAVYHSHGARGAYFSDEDERLARAETRLLGAVLWLVMGGDGEARVFGHDAADDTFRERALVVEGRGASPRGHSSSGEGGAP